MKENSIKDIVEIELSELSTVEPYRTKFVVSLNWDKTVKEVTQEYLEENKAFLIHFITRPTSELVGIPAFEPHLHYPNSRRVLANAMYIGNVDGIEWGGSFVRTMEVVNVYLKNISRGLEWDEEFEEFNYDIIKVIR